MGIDYSKKLNPNLTLKEQSEIVIDALEIDEQLLLPHSEINSIIMSTLEVIY